MNNNLSKEVERPAASRADDDDEYLYLKYLKEYNRSVGPLTNFFDKFARSSNRILLIIMGVYICNTDLMGDQHEPISLSKITSSAGDCNDFGKAVPEKVLRLAHLDDKAQRRLRESKRPASMSTWKELSRRVLPAPRPRSSWWHSLKMVWLAYALQMLYAAAAIILIVDVAYLYRYHISCLRLKRTRELIKVHAPNQRMALSSDLLTDNSDLEFVSNSNFSDLHITSHGGTSLKIPELKSYEIALSLGELERLFSGHANEARKTLSSFNESFADFGLIVEVGYLATLFVGLCLFGILQALYLYANLSGTRLHRDLIDAAEEERRVNDCCETQVLRYLESARVYATLALSSDQFFLGHDGRQTTHLLHKKPYGGGLRVNSVAKEDESRHFSKRLSKIRAVSKEEEEQQQQQRRHEEENDDDQKAKDAPNLSDHRICRFLMQLLLAGALKPLNSSKRLIALTNQGAALLILAVPTFCWVLLTSVAYLIGIIGEPSFRLDVTCLLILVAFNNTSVAFHIVSLLVACLEQTILVNHCLQLIYNCIHLNRRLFKAYEVNCSISKPSYQHVNYKRTQRIVQSPVHGHHRPAAGTIDKIVSNYLFTLMTYKIFAAQFVPFKQTFRGNFLVTFLIAFIIPVLMQIHMPYLQLEDEPGGAHRLRLISLTASVAFLTVADAICLPLCYLHARCQRLYKALSSLLAHIVEVQGHQRGRGIYNEHSVTVLLKELSDPKRMLGQFSVRSLGVGSTFSTLVEIHFWWGLIALSVLIGDTHGNIFSSLISDPLGVWRFRLI